MPDQFSLRDVAQLLAFHEGRAVRYATHRRVVAQPHALILAPLMVPGADTTLLALAVGTPATGPRLLVAHPARDPAAQRELLREAADLIKETLQNTLTSVSPPQCWVSHAAAVEALRNLAEAARRIPDASVEWLARLLIFLTDYTERAGQQLLVTASDAFAAHWAIGIPGERGLHMGVQLAWFDATAATDIWDATEQAELLPSGVTTPSTVDHLLAPFFRRLQHTATAIPAGASPGRPPHRLAVSRDAIAAVVAPIVLGIWHQTARIHDLLQATDLPIPAYVAEQSEADRAELAATLETLTTTSTFVGIRSPRALLIHYDARERAAERIEHLRWWQDALARAEGVLAGHLVDATVARYVRAATARTATIELRCSPTSVRVRPDETFRLWRNPRILLHIVALHHQDGTSHITGKLWRADALTPFPAEGEETRWIPEGGEQLAGEASQMRLRTRILSWVHRSSLPPPVRLAHPPQPPENLVSLMEELR